MAKKSISWRDFKRSDDKTPDEPTDGLKPLARGQRWWLKDPDAAAKAVSFNLDFWTIRQRARIRKLQKYSRYYSNIQNLGSGTALLLQNAIDLQYGQAITLNVSKSVVDTLNSLTTRNRPLPYMLTDDGNRKAQRIAKDRNTYIKGSFEINQTFAKTALATRDALIAGQGGIFIHAEDGRPVHKRVLSQQIYVDDLEALSEAGPRQLHLIELTDRSRLIAQHPDKAKLIEADAWEDGIIYSNINSISDLCIVRHSWHLPSKEGADDGIYLKSLGKGALVMTPWTRPTYPIEWLYYTPPQYGFFGEGLIEAGESIQLAINKTAWSIDETIRRVGSLKIWTPDGSRISPDQLNNDFATIIESAAKPEALLWPLNQPETYTWLHDLINQYFQLAGISAAAAASTKQPGVTSGKAIRLVRDMGTERFMTFAHQYEDFHCRIARQDIMCAMEIRESEKAATKKGETTKPYLVRASNKGTAKVIDFDLLGFRAGEEFTIQCFPISSLSNDPADRTEDVEDLSQAGYIPPDVAKSLLDYPDLGAVESLENATMDFVQTTLDAIIDDNKAYTLDPYDNASVFLRYASEYEQRFKTPGAGVAEKNLMTLRNLIDQCKVKVLAAMPPAPMPGGPQAVPAAPPVSPILPNGPKKVA